MSPRDELPREDCDGTVGRTGFCRKCGWAPDDPEAALLFAAPPGCLMEHEGSFVMSSYQPMRTATVQARRPGADYDFFRFPGPPVSVVRRTSRGCSTTPAGPTADAVPGHARGAADLAGDRLGQRILGQREGGPRR